MHITDMFVAFYIQVTIILMNLAKIKYSPNERQFTVI